MSSSSTSSSRSIIENQKVEHAPADWLPDWMVAERTRVLTSCRSKNSNTKKDSVVYWMQRDVRMQDNWALLWALSLAQQQKLPLRVVYALPPPPQSTSDNDHDESNGYTRLAPTLMEMPMTARHGEFLLGGLELVHQELKEYNIPLDVVLPPSHDAVGQTICDYIVNTASAPAVVVTDFSPLTQPRQWMELQAAPLLQRHKIAMVQVDAHNIVPVWIAGEGKRQVGARTLRPRIHRALPKYLTDFPTVQEILQDPSVQSTIVDLPAFDRSRYKAFLDMDASVPPVEWAKPGTVAGMAQYESFVKIGLKQYDKLRNDPNEKNICSNLSPWINHGHVSFQRITLNAKKLNKHADGTASFIEEGVVRRELSDNYVYYTPNDYDKLQAAAGWAQETLQVHASDTREYVYTLEELEQAKTRDDLWNAAQLQVVREGQMHGFMRMYWAKKILEWTTSPLFALRAAQYFNDKYALDGKDPNGFVGVGWSIMGIHDQGWKEREVFGKIRFMNYNGCKRKFNVAQFVRKYPGAAQNAMAAVVAPNSTATAKTAAQSTTKASASTAGTKKRSTDTASKSSKPSSSSSSSRKRLAKRVKSEE